MSTMKRLEQVYADRFKCIFTRIGLHQQITDSYQYFKSRYYDFKVYQHPGEISHQVGETEASFKVTNRKEYQRFKNLKSERSTIDDILTETNKNDVVFDVGANVGMYTCFLAEKIEKDKIIAFEPHPTNVCALRSNLECNELQATIVEKALSDTSGTAELNVASDKPGEGMHSLASNEGNKTIKIEQTTGDKLIKSGEIPAPSILKIDVEGAEQRVIEGLEETLSSEVCRLCYVEIHPDRLENFGGSEKELQTLLKDSGFDLIELQNRGGEKFVKATKSELDV